MIFLLRMSFTALLGLFLTIGCMDQNETANQQEEGETGAGTESEPYTMGTEEDTDTTATDTTTTDTTTTDTTTTDTTGGTTSDTVAPDDTMGTTTTDTQTGSVTIGEEELNELQEMSFEDRQQFIDGVRQARDSMQQATGQATTQLSSEGQQAMQTIDTNLDRLSTATEGEFEQLKSETLANLRTVRTEVQAH